jgi:peptidyl-prolyl cis-trans isomerase D
MDKAFEDKVYSMKVGEISEPIRTSFGYHIIKLTEIKGDERRASHILFTSEPEAGNQAPVRPFEEVRDTVIRDLRAELAEKAFLEKYDTLNNLTYEHPDTLEVAAEALELQVKSSGLFTRAGNTGIAKHRQVVDAAFSDEVLGQGYNSEVIELSDTRGIVLRIKEHKPAAPRSFEEVKGRIRNRLVQDAAREQVAQKGREIIRQLTDKNSHEAAAQIHQAEWMDVGKVARSDTAKVNGTILDRLFSMPGPEPGKAVFDGIALPSGDYAVIGLYAVHDGDPASIAEEQRNKVREELRNIRVQRDVQNLKRSLKARADIELYPANM